MEEGMDKIDVFEMCGRIKIECYSCFVCEVFMIWVFTQGRSIGF